ncbi:MAG TPA: hypothetical protein V6C72_05000, partial [Chroococcales cyanobacterium]
MQRLLRFNNKPLTILALATLFFVELLPALAASHGEDKGALNVETPALSPTSVTTENAGTGKGAVQSTSSVPANTPLVDPSLFAGPPEPSPSAGFSADAVTRALSSAVGNFHVVS